MANVLDELVQRLALERLGPDSFRGQSQDMGTRALFGGLVLAQSLSAALETLPEDRVAHSLHAYFLRAGDVRVPIDYEVDRSRDGSTFSTRRVVAAQAGKAIFQMAASFQIPEPGFEHHEPMPEAPPPEACLSEHEHLESFGARTPPAMLKRVSLRAFELRTVTPIDDLYTPSLQPPLRKMWLRATGAPGDDPRVHALLLLYASDFMFLTTSLLPHGAAWLTPNLQAASLDHTIWFHHPARVDQWLLYVMESPAAQGARGLVRGRIYTQDGKLVASTAQEGLIRKRGG